MRVTDLEQTIRDDWVRLSARLVPEDGDAPARSLWVELPASMAAEVECSPNVFLPSAVIHAMHVRERRVLIDGTVCPRHLEGMRTVSGILARWTPHLVPPVIEATHGARALSSRGDRAAVCLSGGVDSFAALQENRRLVPPHHPDFMRDGPFYFGLNTYDFDGDAPRPERLAAFADHRARLEAFAATNDLAVIPMRTNVRTLYDSWEAWRATGQTAALVAGAHALPRRVRSLTIGASGIGITTLLHGTHPLLDPHFSTFALDVRTVHAMLSRAEKVARVAEWPDALAVLRVCLMFDVPRGTPNCGECEKCVRTMLELLLCGALDRAPTFPRHEVTPEMILGIPVNENVVFYAQCRDRLASIGRRDLARAIDDRMAALDRATRPTSLVQRLLGR